MREIKFRAWCLKDKKMFQWHEIGLESYGSYVLLPREQGDKIGHRNWDSDLILMQYTGLDKNKKEAYEGDIAKYLDSNYEIAWSSDLLRMVLRPYTIENHYDLNSKVLEKCEVIGNIYENPELLSHEK